MNPVLFHFINHPGAKPLKGVLEQIIPSYITLTKIGIRQILTHLACRANVKKCDISNRAATYTRVKARFRVSAINVYKIYLLFTRTLAHDKRLGLLIAFPNEKNNLLNSDMSHLNPDHQSDSLFSQILLYLIKYPLQILEIMADMLNVSLR